MTTLPEKTFNAICRDATPIDMDWDTTTDKTKQDWRSVVSTFVAIFENHVVMVPIPRDEPNRSVVRLMAEAINTGKSVSELIQELKSYE